MCNKSCDTGRHNTKKLPAKQMPIAGSLNLKDIKIETADSIRVRESRCCGSL